MSRQVDRAFRRFKEHGDPDALAKVFDATADKLFRLAWHLSSDRHAAEEPDALRREIGSFAPDWREGFFVVPPLPGVHAEDGA